MPVVPSDPLFPNQVGASPANQAYVTQLNFGQMLRQVTTYHSGLDAETAGRMINDRYRALLGTRSWYGKKIKGEISIGPNYSTGQATVTNGSNVIQGTGTNWTPVLVGQQFRINFTFPYLTITAVNTSMQQITTDLPFYGNNQTSGYYILQAYVELDANIERMKWAVNQQMGWNMYVNALPVECVNTWDTWRTYQGWSTHFVTRPPTPKGAYQIEVWPSPFQAQVFPYEAYKKPPSLVNDADSVLPFIRSDIVVIGATADALLWRPKKNDFYDPATALDVAARKELLFVKYMEDNAQEDNDIDQQDVSWDYGQGDENTTTGGFGSIYAQNHD